MISKVKPSTPIVKWDACTFVERICDSAAILRAHGFVTDSERAKIHLRMLKWKAHHEQIAERTE